MGSRSRGELKIDGILRAEGLNFKTEYIFPDLVASSGRPLRMDFAVFYETGEIAFCIEYQGEQHYTAVSHFGGKKGVNKQKYNDKKKRIYCLEHNIPLVIIPYYDYDKITYDYILEKAGFL